MLRKGKRKEASQLMNIGRETECVEHKKSTSELKEGMQSIASILNKHGHGELYFGVRDDGEIVGQQIGARTLRDVSQAIASSIEPPVYASVELLGSDEGLQYIRVAFSGEDRPYSCKGVFRLRVSDEDVLMSSSELERQMLDRVACRRPWDGRSSGRDVSDVVPGVVERFVKSGISRDRISEPYTTDFDVLSNAQLLLEDGSLTNAASVLFCKGGSPFRLTMGVLDGNDRVSILDLRQEDGPVFDLIDRAEYFIVSNIRRQLVFGNGVARDEVPEIPRAAIREGRCRVWVSPV